MEDTELLISKTGQGSGNLRKQKKERPNAWETMVCLGNGPVQCGSAWGHLGRLKAGPGEMAHSMQGFELIFHNSFANISKQQSDRIVLGLPKSSLGFSIASYGQINKPKECFCAVCVFKWAH